jgi:hypothetical protein
MLIVRGADAAAFSARSSAGATRSSTSRSSRWCCRFCRRAATASTSSSGSSQFKHNDSIVWFLHCARDSDVVLYQSSNWRKLGVDEASHMTQFIIDYLTTRVRGDQYQVAVLLGSNPGGPGHGWLKRRFVQPTGWKSAGGSRRSRSRSGGRCRRRTTRGAT